MPRRHQMKLGEVIASASLSIVIGRKYRSDKCSYFFLSFALSLTIITIRQSIPLMFGQYSLKKIKNLKFISLVCEKVVSHILEPECLFSLATNGHGLRLCWI